MSALLLAAVLAGADLEAEQAELMDRLEAERAAFESLGGERAGLLSLLDALQQLARDSSARATALERTLTAVARQADEVRREAAAAQEALAQQQARLRPRLKVLYRLQKRDALGALLSATDFAELVRRQRALEALVQTDVTALDELLLLSDQARARERRLHRLDQTTRRYLRALEAERAVSKVRLSRFQDLLRSVTAEQNRLGRAIAELEASERQLSLMVADLQPTTQRSGFRARRGQLPFPTRGIVEVPFGRVVNPRFNTVTVQKGIDVRAAAGAEVVTVSEGTVAFSGWLKGYGNLVIVDHGSGYHSLYAHLESAQVEPGNVVEEGETIGTVGDTGSLKGPYLYFEIRKAGQAIDPLPWLTPE